jgi:hypothetical protein
MVGKVGSEGRREGKHSERRSGGEELVRELGFVVFRVLGVGHLQGGVRQQDPVSTVCRIDTISYASASDMS